MKIRIPYSFEKKEFIKSPIKLTASVLVSNRIDTIQKCLASVKPLLDAIPSELIVVDTVGEENSDGSLAIAREYADKVVHFDWCNDFAAARNAGLELARGEWFMFFDDDEWFDDVSEIIEFFQSGECENYGNAVYPIRNFTSADGSKYTDTPGYRFARRTEGLKFIYPIHEYLHPAYDPKKTFQCHANHYGYCYASEEEHKKHTQRNISLLLEVQKKNPNDPHMLEQLLQEYESDGEYQKALDCAQHGMEVLAPVRMKGWFLAALTRLRFQLRKDEEAIAEGERILKEENPSELVTANTHFILSKACARLNRPEDALSYALKFFQMTRYLKKHPELEQSQQVLSLSNVMLPRVQMEMTNDVIAYRQLLEQHDPLMDFLLEVDWNNKDFSEDDSLLSAVIGTACKSRRFEDMKEIYSGIRNEDGEISDKCVAAIARYLSVAKPDEEQEIYEAAAKIPGEREELWYFRAMACAKEGGEALDQALADCVQHGVTCAAPYHRLLEVCLDNMCDPAPLVTPVYMDDWTVCVGKLIPKREPEKYLEWLNRAQKLLLPVDEIKYRYFTMKVNQLLLADKELFGDPLFTQLCDWAKEVLVYCRLLYRPELFESKAALPREARSALWIEKAKDAKEAGRMAEYLESLRQALVDFPILKEIVEKLVADFEEQKKKAESQKSEFSLLAKMVKGQIRALVEAGSMQEALPLLSQLKLLIPGDEEIAELEELVRV